MSKSSQFPNNISGRAIKEKPALTTLQAGRGVAAFLVLLFHSSVIFASSKYWNYSIFNGLFGFGFSGVDFFFVLSGFIMMYAHRNDFGKKHLLGSFFYKRFARIYPLYWSVTVFVYILYILNRESNVKLISNSFILIGCDSSAILAVAWTLFQEITFYIIFSSIIFSRKIGCIILSCWFCACLCFINVTPPHYMFSSINILFGIGIFTELVYQRTILPIFFLVLGLLSFAFISIESVYFNVMTHDVRNLLFGAAAAIIIGSSAKAEIIGKINTPKWLSGLGDASYSLYLVHYPVLAISAKIWFRTPLRTAPPIIAFIALTVICIFAGFAVHRFIEKPLIRILRRRKKRFIISEEPKPPSIILE